MLFSAGAALFTFPPTGPKSFDSLSTFAISWLVGWFDRSHPKECEAVCHCSYDLHFSHE